jgi:hypothetical protein
MNKIFDRRELLRRGVQATAAATGVAGAAASSLSEGNSSSKPIRIGVVGVGNPLWQPTGGRAKGALELDGVDDYVNASVREWKKNCRFLLFFS